MHRVRGSSIRSWTAGILLVTLGGAAQSATPPDLSGYWQAIKPPEAIKTLTGALPPLLPEARSTYDANQRARAAGDLSFDTTNRCLPPGVPRLMYQNEPFQLIQRAGFVFMLFEYQHLNRQIFLRKDHVSSALGRRFLGDSIAQWDGDTLVVDTTGLKDATLLDAAGLPHSRDLHVTERYRLTHSGSQLEALIRIEDAKTYEQPWETRLSFKRLKQVDFKEDVCVDRHPQWLQDAMRADQ